MRNKLCTIYFPEQLLPPRRFSALILHNGIKQEIKLYSNF
ncbi:hypothetical protein HMPREF9443_02106 [Phascolarctobacterium succinatutens YIT 12067]|uniref:Uncharacterized protein n=1 Tax=Phascolarctobacterium succinatutens YIT 12067 TaxID=626939 RepID=E8LGV0_9FIRM|nr:hypothetical protein HMPREF9443_02106 [Phascolarctobacterium succinatutens YIT 12067]